MSLTRRQVDALKVEGSGSEDSSSTSDEIDDEGGPYVNPRSGSVHEEGPGESNARCGFVPIGYRKLADLSEGGKNGNSEGRPGCLRSRLACAMEGEFNSKVHAWVPPNDPVCRPKASCRRV